MAHEIMKRFVHTLLAAVTFTIAPLGAWCGAETIRLAAQ
jgi:hypothetical protein